jgi:hypothetical protein
MKSIAEVKTSILQSIADCDDEKLLLEIEAFIKGLKDSSNEIVGYSSSGQPLTIKDYQASIAEAQAQYHAGKVISQEDLEREFEKSCLD